MVNYFGTNTREAGHYFFELGEYFSLGNLNFKAFPFNPESLPRYEKGEQRKRGDVRFYHVQDYHICAIYGSCVDDRPGCKSVFFVKGIEDNHLLMKMILETPAAKAIIDKMPFDVMHMKPLTVILPA